MLRDAKVALKEFERPMREKDVERLGENRAKLLYSAIGYVADEKDIIKIKASSKKK